MPHAVLGGRRSGRGGSRAIVEVRAAANNLDAEFRQQFFDPRVEFAFAEIATGAVVAQVIGVLKLVGGDDDVADCRCGVASSRASASSLRGTLALSPVTRDRAITERLARSRATTVLSIPPLNAPPSQAVRRGLPVACRACRQFVQSLRLHSHHT